VIPGVSKRPVFAGALAVAAIAAINFLYGLGAPAHPLWDENYYLTAVERYHEGRAQFASHPPLGLLLITAGDALLGSNRALDTEALGRKKDVRGESVPANYDFRGIRVASGISAVIGAVLFFLLMLALSRRLGVALLLANVYVFDNALVAHFRAAHLDSFQVTFALAALLCFVMGARRRGDEASWTDFALGLACGLSAMVKLNAAVLGLLGVMLIVRRWYAGLHLDPMPVRLFLAARDGLIMATGCALAIVGVLTAHLVVGSKPPDNRGTAGQKDERFVSATYRSYLAGEQSLSLTQVVAVADDYLRYIRADFKGIVRTDRNGSLPLQWMVGQRPINYRWDFDGKRTAYVQLLSNPVSWGMALVAVAASIWMLISQWRRPTPVPSARRDLMAMLLLLYVVLMAIHAYLGRSRVMYLYHYFLALLPAYCLLPLVMEEAAERWQLFRKYQVPALTGVTALLLASFLFYSPLTFHQKLTRQQCELRNVLQRVVVCQPVKPARPPGVRP